MRHRGTGFSNELIPLLREHLPGASGLKGYAVDAAVVVPALEEELRRRCAETGSSGRSLEHILQYGEHPPEQPNLEDVEELASLARATPTAL